MAIVPLDRGLEKLLTFDADAADLEDEGDDEPEGSDEEDGPPVGIPGPASTCSSTSRRSSSCGRKW